VALDGRRVWLFQLFSIKRCEKFLDLIQKLVDPSKLQKTLIDSLRNSQHATVDANEKNGARTIKIKPKSFEQVHLRV
jgi:hypothetical protein